MLLRYDHGTDNRRRTDGRGTESATHIWLLKRANNKWKQSYTNRYCTSLQCAIMDLNVDAYKKNLAIANRSRVSCAHNRPIYVEGIYRPKYYTVTLKSRLRVTQGHWKRNHWRDHTRLLLGELFDLEYYRDLEMWVKVTQDHWKWYHLKAWVRFPIRLP